MTIHCIRGPKGGSLLTWSDFEASSLLDEIKREP